MVLRILQASKFLVKGYDVSFGYVMPQAILKARLFQIRTSMPRNVGFKSRSSRREAMGAFPRRSVTTRKFVRSATARK